jgi:hypothetical protein
VNVTEIQQVPPGPITRVQVPLVAVKSGLSATLTALMCSVALPVFVIRVVRVADAPILTVRMSSTLALDVISDAVAVPVTSGCGAIDRIADEGEHRALRTGRGVRREREGDPARRTSRDRTVAGAQGG